MIVIDGDRRYDDRVRLKRPCKVFDPHAGKYWMGETINLSTGGALLRLLRPLEIRPGDTLYVGVAFKRRQGLIHSHEMMEAVVRHAMRACDDATILGVQFPAMLADGDSLTLAA